jgi:hypothetical protein
MFYRSVLQIKCGYQPKLKACKDKQGKIIEDEMEVIIDGLNILKNCFLKLCKY